MIGALSDITERRELERQLVRTQRLETVGTLASGIAHDLNNVFTPIAMGLDLLGTQRMDAEQREILQTVRASAQRGAQLVKQVLSFARGQAGHRVPVQPAELVREIERMMRETFPRNITIAVHVAGTLPHVMGDATQLHQVLLNLCLNARDAMPGGGTLEIRAGVATLAQPMRSVSGDVPAGRYVRFDVTDDGAGMDDAVVERLFEPFFTTKPVGAGTGLGLPTALSIVRKHGGGMQVQSEPRQGSRFTVWLPASDRIAATVADEPDRRPARGRGQTVLVVDDEEAVRDMACRALSAAGYVVDIAADGAQALEVLRSRDCDVLFTDLMMPVMDGASLVRQALSIAPSLRVVCASGVNADDATLPAGAVFLPKPYSADALACAVGDALVQVQPARERRGRWDGNATAHHVHR
jgi:nitrogen-specific signal transduction histidine kinase/ActR/RegA family two-component response regulator